MFTFAHTNARTNLRLWRLGFCDEKFAILSKILLLRYNRVCSVANGPCVCLCLRKFVRSHCPVVKHALLFSKTAEQKNAMPVWPTIAPTTAMTCETCDRVHRRRCAPNPRPRNGGNVARVCGRRSAVHWLVLPQAELESAYVRRRRRWALDLSERRRLTR